jgi:photosystem II stability/assembly factor-like uncharacterized protein/subtilisin-like proprotein convertase family protein
MRYPGNLSKCLIGALLCFYSLTAVSQQVGWQWQNPYLQGNDLNSIVMSGSVGWAVGALGTVMKTSNEGYDWEIVDLGTSENFNSIYMDVISGNGWIVGNKGLIFYTADGGETWQKQYSATTEDLFSVTAIEGDCPWICGNEVILRSYDHGENWEWISSIFQSRYFSISLKDCDEAWISGMQGLVINTTDGGATWQSHPTSTTNQLFCIDVVANGDYRACGYTGTIVRSSDGGTSWVKEHEQTFLYLYNVDTKGIGGPAYAVGGQGTILETLDGGTTWNQRVSGTYTYLNDVCFQALFHAVYVTGWYGIILRKEDQPDAEFEVMNETPLHFMQGMDFINESQGWAVGWEEISDGIVEGVIMHTADGGDNWEVQAILPDGMLAVDFINESEGWAVGNDGLIKHTVNGGQNWATQDSPIGGQLTSVFFFDENNGWIVSRDNWGEIIHTTNGGSSWTLQTEPSLNPLSDVFFINASKGWVVGMDSTIMRTEDGGQTWLKCHLEVSNNPYLRSVQFIDEMTGWAVGTQGFILKTEDGGKNWYDINTDFYELLQSVYFADPLNGWAVGDAGTILRSINGGNTWFRQYSGVERGFLTSVCFTDKLNGWIAGEGGTIKGTNNGGFWNEPGTFLRNRLKIPVADLNEARDTLLVDVLENRESGYYLSGVEVMIDSIIHPRASDLIICLTHDGITDTLVRNVSGEGTDFLWTRLVDGAPVMINYGDAPFSGIYRPYKSLSAFNGLDPDGEWILTVYDSQAGEEGSLKAWGIKPLFERPVAVDEPAGQSVEKKIRLSQNIPNPFTVLTTINWSSEISGFTTLKVFNIDGQEVATLVDRFLSVGDHSVEFNGSGLGAGVYYYKLQVGGYILAKKCIIL